MDRRFAFLIAAAGLAWFACVGWIVATQDAPSTPWRAVAGIAAAALPLVIVAAGIASQRRR